MILIPNTGRVETKTGNNAQCIAQATDVAIPIISQLIFVSIFKSGKDMIFAIMLQVLNCFKFGNKL